MHGHINRMKRLLSLSRDVGVTLKLTKGVFFTGTLEYYGHIIRLQCLEIVVHTTDAIKGLKTRTNITERRLLLGLCNVFHCSVLNFAQIPAPLNKKLTKYKPKHFSALKDENLCAMHKLKETLV